MHLGDGACFGDCLPLLLCLGNLNPDLNEKVVIFYIDLLLDTFNGTTPINKCFISYLGCSPWGLVTFATLITILTKNLD